MLTLLQKAQDIISGARRKTYGHPSKSFGRIALLWSAYLGVTIRPTDVALMMILLKVSRSREEVHYDDILDIAGYAGLVEELQDFQDAKKLKDELEEEISKEENS